MEIERGEVPVRLVASAHVTLDGVMGAPEKWSFQFFDEDSERQSLDELVAADAVLMGRVTYEGFVEYWPSATDPIAERMNALPKYVVSTTLKDVEWNNSTLIADASRAKSRDSRTSPEATSCSSPAPISRTVSERRT